MLNFCNLIAHIATKNLYKKLHIKNWISNKNMHAKYKFIQIAIGIFSHFPTSLLSKTRYIHLRLKQKHLVLLFIKSQSIHIHLYPYLIPTDAAKNWNKPEM